MKLVKKVIGSSNSSKATDSQKIMVINRDTGDTKAPPGGPLNTVYASLKGVVHETLQRNKLNSMVLARLKNSHASTFNGGLEELERIVADRIGRLKEAVKEGEAVVSREAQHAEQVTEGLRASIAVLEARIKEMEEAVRKKDSDNQRTEESLTAKIRDLQSEVTKKEEALENRANEIRGLTTKIEALNKRAIHLESIIEQAKARAAREAERVEHLAEGSKAKISALETQLRETDGVVREKDSAIKILEHDLTAKIQQLESQARNKDHLLASRVKEIDDLTSQLEALKNGIKNMSSFSRQTESLSTIEAQAIGTGVPSVQAKTEEKQAALQSSNPIVPAKNTDDLNQQTVSPDFFNRLTNELAAVLGPMASMIIRHDVAALGESMEGFPKVRVTELLESVTKEIANERLKIAFRTRLGL
jgi:DNA repair exonuclease SbcCD ATPase subunit